jgi:Tol biopolymer transport system component
VDNDPVWSPDGASIAFASNRDGGVFNLYRKNSAGTGEEELLLKTPNNKIIDDWSADGRYILYEEVDPKNKEDLWVLPLFGDRKPIKFMGTPFNEWLASFSPDGHWIAYTSDESGRSQVYVQSFPTASGKWQVSTTASGSGPRWRHDSKEIFYDGAGPMMAVDLTGTVPGGQFKAGTSQQLFTGLMNLPPHNFDLSADGKRFLVVSGRDLAGAPSPIVVVLNWKLGLKP